MDSSRCGEPQESVPRAKQHAETCESVPLLSVAVYIMCGVALHIRTTMRTHAFLDTCMYVKDKKIALDATSIVVVLCFFLLYYLILIACRWIGRCRDKGDAWMFIGVLLHLK